MENNKAVVIGLNDITKILDQALESCKNSDSKFKNILFYRETGFGVNHIVERWIHSHRDEYSSMHGIMPGVLHTYDENMILKKVIENGKYVYLFDDEYLAKLTETKILFFENLNYGTLKEQYEQIAPIVNDRKYISPFFKKEYIFNNLQLFIGTCYPNNGRYHVNDIPDSMFENCEVYCVDTGRY